MVRGSYMMSDSFTRVKLVTIGDAQSAVSKESRVVRTECYLPALSMELLTTGGEAQSGTVEGVPQELRPGNMSRYQNRGGAGLQ